MGNNVPLTSSKGNRGIDVGGGATMVMLEMGFADSCSSDGILTRPDRFGYPGL